MIHSTALGAYIQQKQEAKGIQLVGFARQPETSAAYWLCIVCSIENPPKNEPVLKVAAVLGERVNFALVDASRLALDLRVDASGLVRM